MFYAYVVSCLIELVFLCEYALASTIWHPYIEHKKCPDECYDNATSSLLPQYERSNWARRPMSLEFMQRYKLWPDLISKFDLIHGETMFGLEEARGGVQAPAPSGLLQGQYTYRSIAIVISHWSKLQHWTDRFRFYRKIQYVQYQCG